MFVRDVAWLDFSDAGKDEAGEMSTGGSLCRIWLFGGILANRGRFVAAGFVLARTAGYGLI